MDRKDYRQSVRASVVAVSISKSIYSDLSEPTCNALFSLGLGGWDLFGHAKRPTIHERRKPDAYLPRLSNAGESLFSERAFSNWISSIRSMLSRRCRASTGSRRNSTPN